MTLFEAMIEALPDATTEELEDLLAEINIELMARDHAEAECEPDFEPEDLETGFNPYEGCYDFDC